MKNNLSTLVEYRQERPDQAFCAKSTRDATQADNRRLGMTISRGYRWPVGRALIRSRDKAWCVQIRWRHELRLPRGEVEHSEHFSGSQIPENSTDILDPSNKYKNCQFAELKFCSGFSNDMSQEMHVRRLHYYSTPN
ncbi:hypothetical protein RRG08_046823 [Elysia crispata]|uniref:Uncharacterized protein n=1 Tax=Elysia crispata TaxID=231223 RepID=A0AAE0ZN52_9GAST|nr:hypothetical protein RRG08_046823 [Elysia crispata]